MASKHPKFQRANYKSIKRVKASWRKPRGIDSKARQKLKSAGAHPNKGYRTPKAKRNLHPSGKPENLIHNVTELLLLKTNTLARIARTVGAKKRAEIKKAANEKKIKILN